MESTSFAVYAHLTPTSRPTEICETVKLEVRSPDEINKKVEVTHIGDLA